MVYLLASTYCNTYLFTSMGEGLLIDCSASPEAVKEKLGASGAVLTKVFITHCHYDHLVHYNELRAAFPEAKFYVHKDEKKLFSDEVANVSALFFNPQRFPLPTDFVGEGDLILLGQDAFTVIHTPGHTPGSCCLYNEEKNFIFTGDTLFHRGIGRTDFKYGDYGLLEESLGKLSQLDDMAEFFPGHGDRGTLLEEFWG